MTWLTVMEYLCHKWSRVCSTCRKHFWSFSHSWLITGFVTRLTRRESLVEQGLPIFPEHMSSPPVFSVVRVTRSLVLCVCFVDRCLSFCTFSFGHCVVCSVSIYGFWLPRLYLHSLLKTFWIISILVLFRKRSSIKTFDCILSFLMKNYNDRWKVLHNKWSRQYVGGPYR
jgi:hypothetical protein